MIYCLKFYILHLKNSYWFNVCLCIFQSRGPSNSDILHHYYSAFITRWPSQRAFQRAVRRYAHYTISLLDVSINLSFSFSSSVIQVSRYHRNLCRCKLCSVLAQFWAIGHVTQFFNQLRCRKSILMSIYKNA